MSESQTTRREFLKSSVLVGAGLVAVGPMGRSLLSAATPGTRMKFGLVTYLWGQDWPLPTLIANCHKTGVLGVELRTQHAHGVESNLTKAERADVKKRFDDSDVTLVGLGTNFAFHYPERDRLRKEIEGAKAYVLLSADCGGSGVKVKPNDLPKGVPYEKTIQQIGESLHELGEFGAQHGQEIRLEVHGSCSPLPVIKSIMDATDHPNVRVCWNCNGQDLEGEGLQYNFHLVRPFFGQTAHVRELNIGDYPYQDLIDLMVGTDYDGWILLEARTKPDDRVKALAEQKVVFGQMVAKAQAGGTKTHGRRQDHATHRQGHGGSQRQAVHRVLLYGRAATVLLSGDRSDGPAPVTRNWPMADGPHEAHDHPHHKSLWFTHGDVNGIDFWADGNNKGKIVHDKFLEISSGPDVGVIKSQNNWVAPDGKMVCTDTRTQRFYNRPDGQIMDWEVTVHASHGKIVFGDTKEGSMATRLTPTMRLKGEVGQGHIVNSEGVRDGQTWGKRAAWCDYYGPVDGNVVGIAIFDHPDNPRHPTWWHVRDYGLFAANPFGVHYFEGKPAGTGDLTVPAGESITFKWRFYFHKGNEVEGKVAEHYREYAS